MVNSLYSQIHQDLQALSNPEKAEGARKYLRNQFYFFGLTAPERKLVLNPIYPKFKSLSSNEKGILTRKCWESKEREFCYVAIDLWKRNCRKLQETDILLFEYMLTNRSWWDTVDLIASNLVGAYAKQWPEAFKPVWESWVSSNHFWLNRTAIIFQLKYRNETHIEMLESAIIPHLRNTEFFLQKAIGWSLREYRKWNPNWVDQFIDQYNIQGLARREALKHVRLG